MNIRVWFQVNFENIFLNMRAWFQVIFENKFLYTEVWFHVNFESMFLNMRVWCWPSLINVSFPPTLPTHLFSPAQLENTQNRIIGRNYKKRPTWKETIFNVLFVSSHQNSCRTVLLVAMTKNYPCERRQNLFPCVLHPWKASFEHISSYASSFIFCTGGWVTVWA